MIDRREFVQSMIALGAATTLRPASVLFAAPNQELKGLADAALATAKQAGASYADIRINRYRNQFLFTRDRRVQNIVNTEDFGFGVRVLVDGTWGFASSSAVTKDDVAAIARQAVGDRQGEQDRQHRSGPARAGRGLSRRRVEHAGEEGSVRGAAAAEDRSAAADQRGGARRSQGASFVSAFMLFVNEKKFFASTDGLVHHPVADPLLPDVLGHVGRSRDQPLLPAQRADRADGHGLRVHREPAAARRKRSRPPRKRSRCTRPSRPSPGRRR